MDIDLSTDAPASPERTRHLAETLAEIARVLNHTTTDRAAFGVPSDVDRVLREVASAAARFPQLFSQVAARLTLEDDEGRIVVPSGEWAGRPHTAVTALQVRLDMARADAGELCASVEHAAQVTSALAAPDPEEDSDGLCPCETNVTDWCETHDVMRRPADPEAEPPEEDRRNSS